MNLPIIDIGINQTVLAVSTGPDFICALLDTEQVECLGMNTWYQLGHNGISNQGRSTGSMGGNLAVLDFGPNKNVKYIKTGEAHGCAILQDDTVKCWGGNGDGQLGNEDGGYVSVVGNNWSTRGNLNGDASPIVRLGTGVTASFLSCGGSHTCIISHAGEVKCWGGNIYGQCGSTSEHGANPNTMGDNLQTVRLVGDGSVAIHISVGFQHTCELWLALLLGSK